jgi:transposase InsO family protein
VCSIAKATRLTFGDVSVRGKCPLEIVHFDIVGPIKPAENNDMYYMTYIDDFTGYLCAYSMPDKTAASVLSSFRIFQAMVERAFDCKIQVLRTEGGGEYKELMGQYLRQAGIVQLVTTPYTPKLNSRAERMNRTIKGMLASMLIAAKIDMRFWNFGLKHACVLWNTGIMHDGITLEERFTSALWSTSRFKLSARNVGYAPLQRIARKQT